MDAQAAPTPHETVSANHALAELARCSVTQFDSQVIKALGQLTFEVEASPA